MFTASIINDYAANPINNFKMDDATVSYSEWNSICDDSIEVFLKINKDWFIENFSYIGELSIVWLAAASILAEELDWELNLDGSRKLKNIDELLTWDYEYMKSLWFEVSPKRKRAAVMPLLAARNAIHDYKNDGLKDDFDDLVEC